MGAGSSNIIETDKGGNGGNTLNTTWNKVIVLDPPTLKTVDVADMM